MTWTDQNWGPSIFDAARGPDGVDGLLEKLQQDPTWKSRLVINDYPEAESANAPELCKSCGAYWKCDCPPVQFGWGPVTIDGQPVGTGRITNLDLISPRFLTFFEPVLGPKVDEAGHSWIMARSQDQLIRRACIRCGDSQAVGFRDPWPAPEWTTCPGQLLSAAQVNLLCSIFGAPELAEKL